MPNVSTAVHHMLQACPSLEHFINLKDIPTIEPVHTTVGDALTEIIVSQMLNSSDAHKILACMRRKAGSGKIWRLSQEDLFTCGVSRSKARTIHLMGKHYDDDSRAFELWRSEPEAKVREEIKLLWGLGDWTVDRLLLHYFGHLDIWPQHDLTINHAIEKLHRTCHLQGLAWRLEPDLARPYRSYLTKILWQIDEMHLQQLRPLATSVHPAKASTPRYA